MTFKFQPLLLSFLPLRRRQSPINNVKIYSSINISLHFSFENKAESYGKGPKQSAVPDRTNTQQYAPKSPSGVPAPQGNRLPTDLAPYHQNIVLRPHIYSGDTDTFYFDGRTEIFFNVLKATNTFQINFQALAFSQGSIRITNLATGALVEWLTLELDEDDFTFTLALATSLEVGQKYKFECGYSGPLYQDFAGLYWDVYYKDDQPRWVQGVNL